MRVGLESPANEGGHLRDKCGEPRVSVDTWRTKGEENLPPKVLPGLQLYGVKRVEFEGTRDSSGGNTRSSATGDAKEHAAATTYVELAVLRCEGDLAGGVCPTGVNNLEVAKTINSACVRGEEPQGL